MDHLRLLPRLHVHLPNDYPWQKFVEGEVQKQKQKQKLTGREEDWKKREEEEDWKKREHGRNGETPG